ncbi:type I polyketide synthase [Streptomyces sp. NPDC050560]|uniref:type I polyketide synthase n=1 Tax=Streptomyces sp. NPDC050560 TaxID=3365630 RepID=UPI0037B5BC40
MGEDSVSVLAVDVSGQPVLSVESLTTRPVDAARLNAASTPPLHHVTWVDVPAPPVDAGTATVPWAVLGHEDAYGLGLELFDGLAALGAELPETLVVPVPEPEGDVIAGVSEATVRVLALLREWLREERYTVTRLLVLTGGGLAGRTVAGLVRSAQSENPGRIVLVEAEAEAEAGTGTEGGVTLGLLRAAVASGEPQLTLVGGTLKAPRLASRTVEPAEVSLSGSVLVTGGTGVLGGIVARHLVERGAEHVVLVSRSGREAEGAAGLESELAGLGARVTLAACDVADRAGLEELIRGIEPPLTGVVHTAGVLDDGTVESLTADQLARVLRPKAEAAWHLHELTRDLDLTLFALYSSAAGVFGNPGQGNYAAANAFLDALAEHRRAQGLPAVSLAWGLWEDGSGMTAHLDDAHRGRMRRTGLRALTAAEGMALFDAGLAADLAVVVPARLDLSAVRARGGDVPHLLRGLVRPARPMSATGGGEGPSLERRLAALPVEERQGAVLDLVRGEVAGALGYADAADIDAERAFKDLGFDSLTAVELRNRLSAATGLKLPATLVFDHPTPAAIAGHLLTRLAPAPASGAHTGASGVGDGADAEELRRVLLSVPLDRLREAGVLDTVLRLADTDGATGGEAQPADSPAAEDSDALLDGMDADALVRQAMDLG